MERAVLGLCANKLVVFVTHDLDHAAQMETVIYLQGKDKPPQVMNAEEYKLHMEQLRGVILKNSTALQDNGPSGNSDQIFSEEDSE